MFKELKLYSICSTYSVAYINAGIILFLNDTSNAGIILTCAGSGGRIGQTYSSA